MGEALQQREIDMHVEPLGLEAGEAIRDHLEGGPHGIEMVEPLKQAEVGEIVGDQFVAQKGQELLILFEEAALEVGAEDMMAVLDLVDDRGQLAMHPGRTWVTRQGVHVDRIACSWLIRRFIDSDAVIHFVAGKGYLPKAGELRFDMFEGEFTHEGDRCSFEVLLARSGISDPGLQAIAEIVHDIDLKDGKFKREEATGIARLIAGITMANKDDEQRITQGSPIFDNLYQSFRTNRG
jgi:hypothetical protein